MAEFRAMDAQAERAAANEALLREVNDRIEDVGERLRVLPEDERLDFRCECGQSGCDAMISMSVREYVHVRSDNDRFAVTPGHEDTRIERVVERRDGYLIVDKRPEAERFVGADGLPDSGA
jgi:acetone carboxylase gamma subunit